MLQDRFMQRSAPRYLYNKKSQDTVGPRPFRNAASFAGSRTTRGEVEVSRNMVSLVIAVVVIIVLIWLILQFV